MVQNYLIIFLMHVLVHTQNRIFIHDEVAIKASDAHYCHTLQLQNHIALFIRFWNHFFVDFFFLPNMGEAPEVFYINGFSKFGHETQQQNHVNDQNHDSSWYEEIIDDDLKWSFKLNRFVIASSNSLYKSSNKNFLSLLSCFINIVCGLFHKLNSFLLFSTCFNSVLHKAISEYQDIALLDTKRFGKVCKLFIIFFFYFS